MRGKIRFYWSDSLPPLTKRDVLQAIGLWTVVVCVSAAPSFVLGLLPAENAWGVWGMELGVLLFVVGYVVWAVSPWGRRLSRLPFVKAAAFVGYGTRIAMSVIAITGVGAIPDMLVGLFVAYIVRLYFQPSSMLSGWAQLVFIFIWTVMVAITWNAILFVLMAMVYGAQRLFRKMPVGRPGEACLRCGYDVRMSQGACPECGEPIPEMGLAVKATA